MRPLGIRGWLTPTVALAVTPFDAFPAAILRGEDFGGVGKRKVFRPSWPDGLLDAVNR